jgi:hypothetical protein
MLNSIAASATSCFSPGIQRVPTWRGLLRVRAHPLVGLGHGGEEFLDRLAVLLHPGPQRDVEAQIARSRRRRG